MRPTNWMEPQSLVSRSKSTWPDPRTLRLGVEDIAPVVAAMEEVVEVDSGRDVEEDVDVEAMEDIIVMELVMIEEADSRRGVMEVVEGAEATVEEGVEVTENGTTGIEEMEDIMEATSPPDKMRDIKRRERLEYSFELSGRHYTLYTILLCGFWTFSNISYHYCSLRFAFRTKYYSFGIY